MPKEYFKKKGQSNSFKMTNPFKQAVEVKVQEHIGLMGQREQSERYLTGMKLRQKKQKKQLRQQKYLTQPQIQVL